MCIRDSARSIDYLKQFAKLPGFGQSVLYRKEVKENTPFQMKTDAYTDALNALDKYASILDKAGSKKKSKFALKMLKSLQRNFFMKEIKGGPLGSVASSDIQDIRVNIGRLIGLANGSQADEVFSKIKPSKKALKAADKLIGKVS